MTDIATPGPAAQAPAQAAAPSPSRQPPPHMPDVKLTFPDDDDDLNLGSGLDDLTPSAHSYGSEVEHYIFGRRSQPPAWTPPPSSQWLSQTGDPTKASRLKDPESFDGNDQSKAEMFLHRCALQFMAFPNSYRDDNAKVAYILSYMVGGPAGEWAAAVIERVLKLQEKGLPADVPYHAFRNEF